MGQPAGNLHDDLLTIQDGLPIWITVALSNHPDLLKAFLPPWRKSAPEHLELMVLEARVLRSAGDTRGARGILDAVDARWPWMADAKVLRGEIALDLNERGEANALLLEASKLDPHAIGLAEAMRRWNSLQQPVTDTQQGPGEPPGAPAQDTPAALLQQAQGAMDRNDLARAQELLLAAITKDPTYSAPFLALAKLLLANADPRMARKVIEAGLDNNPGNAILWDHLIAISVAHEPDRVRTDVRDALAAAPEGGGGRWHQLAALDLMQQGAKEKALQILDKGQHLFPENAHLLEMRRRHFPGR
jgi:tetratricopeptide (TPR) repeat protein